MCANNWGTYSTEVKKVESYIHIVSPNKLKNYNSNLMYSVCNTFKISDLLLFPIAYIISMTKRSVFHHCAVFTC